MLLLFNHNITEAKKDAFVWGYKDTIHNDRAEPGWNPVFFYIEWGVIKIELFYTGIGREHGVKEGEFALWTMQNHVCEGSSTNWNHLKKMEQE